MIAGSVLAGTTLGLSAALSGCGQFAPGLLDGGRVSTIGEVDFTEPLAIPALAESTTDASGTRVFDLTAAQSQSIFSPGSHTPTLGYSTPEASRSYLGPTLDIGSGERVRVDVHNELGETTTFHLHGMHLPAAMDGGPHQPIAAGATWSPEWVVAQQAATLWYHPHPHGETESQVARGLAGMVIVRDEEEAQLGLPRSYGVDDIPVIVQDASFADDGAFSVDDRGFVGRLGDTLLVNGTTGPFFTVTTEAVRLRLLNASTARTYDLGFADDLEFVQIASDGGLLAHPVPTTRVQLSPGERAEIVVRLSAGQTLTLRSTPPDLGTESTPGARNGAADSFDVLELRAASDLTASAVVPATLAKIDTISEAEADITRTMRMNGFVINGQPMDLARIDDVVEVGSTEIWILRNEMDLPHNFHVHDVQFQVLSIDGRDPPPALAGWKDTVYLPPQSEVRIITRFDDYTDPALPYMYHCHLLWHEDQGMMGQFVVVAPGQGAGTIQGDNHEH